MITAQKPVDQTLVDRTVYPIGADLQSTAGPAADVLNNITPVEVDADGGLSLRGDTAVTTLVDGQTLHRLVITPTPRGDCERRQIGRIGYLGLVYSFGATEQPEAPGFEYDR